MAESQGREVHGSRRRAQRVQMSHGRNRDVRPASQRPARGQKLLQPRIRDGFDEAARQEAVGEGRELFVFRQMIGGADADPQRAVDAGVPLAEQALVQHAEQGVENGGGAQKHLVEKDDVRLGQHARGFGLDDALLELAQVDRAENFGRFGEAPDQIFEIAAAEAPGDAAHGLAFGRSGRADDQEMLAGHGAEDYELHQRLSLHQTMAGLFDGAADALRC